LLGYCPRSVADVACRQALGLHVVHQRVEHRLSLLGGHETDDQWHRPTGLRVPQLGELRLEICADFGCQFGVPPRVVGAVEQLGDVLQDGHVFVVDRDRRQRLGRGLRFAGGFGPRSYQSPSP